MAELHEQEVEFARLLDGLPFDDTRRPEQAAQLRTLALARFAQAARVDAATAWWKHALQEGREIMRHPISRLIAGVVCLAIFAVWLLAPGRQSTAQAFQKFAEAVVQAKTARFQMEVAMEGQPRQTFQAFYLAPGKFRQELGFMVNVSDLQAGKMVSLMPAQKRALVANLKGRPPMPKDKLTCDAFYFERLRELLAGSRDAQAKQYQHLGEKDIDGKRAVGFRYDSPIATITLWGDPKTGLPVRLETVWSGIPRTEVVMSHFEFNVPLKESLFDVTPPADYKVQSFDVDLSPSREQDLLKAFQACSAIGAGEFPETMDMAGLSNMIAKYAVSHPKEISDERVQQLMKQSIEIGRGFQFALELPPSADAYYAGKGVKQGERERPIFWYKPEGARHYRVLYADLTFRDADSAPQVAGARRITKASETHRPVKEAGH
jgi:outer membrane lipoprotein-sorting protein